MQRAPQAALVLLFVCACSKASTAPESKSTEPSDPAVVGTWCFKPTSLRATWDLVQISREPSYVLWDRFGDGSTQRQELKERDGALWIADSPSGDHYILPAAKGGELVVADNDGVFGRARTMPDNSKPADCFDN